MWMTEGGWYSTHPVPTCARAAGAHESSNETDASHLVTRPLRTNEPGQLRAEAMQSTLFEWFSTPRIGRRGAISPIGVIRSPRPLAIHPVR
jgi:hypothetical protein